MKLSSSSESIAVAVIPARGGSKRIPRKNIRDFCGKPIIAYSILAAQRANIFDKIVVSSEDTEIIRVALKWGADSICRPKDLADDFTPTEPVIRHAISNLESNGTSPDAICCIYPTNPFLSPEDLLASYEVLKEGKWDHVLSAIKYSHPIQRAFRIKEDASAHMLNPEQLLTRTQDLEDTFHDGDKFYWGTRSAWMDKNPMFTFRTKAIEIPGYLAHGIDTEEDWVRAELIFTALSVNNKYGI